MPAEIALQRIVAQRLAGPLPASPAGAVAHLTAVQAQDLRSAGEAVALRTAPAGTGLAEALESGDVVRTWTSRGTLHLTTPTLLPGILALTAERQLHQAATRRAGLGIDDALVARAADLAVARIDGAGAASRSDLSDAWAGLPGVGEQGVVYHLIFTLSALKILVQGPPHPTRAGEQLFVRYESAVQPAEPDPEEALAAWAAGFARSRGPVTDRDFARFTGLPLTQARRGLEAAAMSGDVERVEIEGTAHYRDPAVLDLLAEHRRAAEGLHLIPAFDEVIIGYADRTATLSPAHETEFVVPGKNGVFRPVVIHRGRAIGTWSRDGGAEGVTLFGPPTAVAKRDLTRRFRQ